MTRQEMNCFTEGLHCTQEMGVIPFFSKIYNVCLSVYPLISFFLIKRQSYKEKLLRTVSGRPW